MHSNNSKGKEQKKQKQQWNKRKKKMSHSPIRENLLSGIIIDIIISIILPEILCMVEMLGPVFKGTILIRDQVLLESLITFERRGVVVDDHLCTMFSLFANKTCEMSVE